MALKIVLFFPDKGIRDKPFFLNVTGKKEKGWSVRKSQYRIIVKIRYRFMDPTQSPPPIKFQKVNHQIIVRAIHGGKNKTLETVIQTRIAQSFPHWVKRDVERFRDNNGSQWEIDTKEITDLRVERIG